MLTSFHYTKKSLTVLDLFSGQGGEEGGGVGGLTFKSVRKVQIRPQFDYHKNTQYLPITFKTEYPHKGTVPFSLLWPPPFPQLS